MEERENLQGEEQLVVFTAGSEEYGLEISQVQEIIRLQAITRIPRSPDYVEGVINLRGNIVPVINLHQRLSLGERQNTDNSRIIIVQEQEAMVGIIVDSVTEVISLSREAIEPPSGSDALNASSYLKGIGRIGERLILLLDLEAVLGSKAVAV